MQQAYSGDEQQVYPALHADFLLAKTNVHLREAARSAPTEIAADHERQDVLSPSTVVRSNQQSAESLLDRPHCKLLFRSFEESMRR
jgi:hypothetical protein